MIMRKVAVFILFVSVSFSFADSTFASDVTTLVVGCADCHGRDGASTEKDVPIIAGYSEPYLVDSMTDYKTKERPCPETTYRSGEMKGRKSDMCQIVEALSDVDIQQVANYFAGKKFVSAVQTFDSAQAVKGKEIHEQSCAKCHTEGGSLASDDDGILAGQWMPYLEESFKEFTSGDRKMPRKMKVVMDKLEKADLEALVNFYGSIKLHY